MTYDNPLHILGWKQLLQVADLARPTEHLTKFMDYYFAGSPETRIFDLKEQRILESIKSIPRIITVTNEFNQRMQREINAQIVALKNDSNCRTNQTIAFEINQDLHVNLTTNGNFSLGQTTIKAIGKVNMLKQKNRNVSVINARIDYILTDRFDDVPDILNCTNPDGTIPFIELNPFRVNTRTEELIGGAGYAIEGKWSTGIGNYPHNVYAQ